MAEGQPPNEDFTAWMTVAVLAMTALAILVIIIFRLAMKRVMEEREKMRQAELTHQQTLLYNSISIQERERQRIAANLHDELSSRLHVLKMSLYEIKDVLPQLSVETNRLLDETIRISRNISHELYPPLLAELGIAETLRDYLYPIREQLLTKLYIYGETGKINSVQQLQLFRIFQELLQNVVKHSGASQFCVILKVTGSYIAMKVSDNGDGFNTGKVKNGLGFGNIESRVQMLKGRYKIKSAAGRGTTAIIVILLDHEQNKTGLS